MTRPGFADLAAGAAVLAILAAERARPLRPRGGGGLPRLALNVALGLGCAAVIAAVVSPLTNRVARANARRPRGAAALAPERAGQIAAFLALDYLMYGWHVATHRVPLLWRLHRVHHADPELDASTALRFHMADMLTSLPFRLLQVRLAGADPATHAAWTAFFSLSVLFHHANLRLPGGWDRRLAHVITTPTMHGLHHALDRRDRDSNWSSGISWWDHLHGTFRAGPQPTAIGAPRVAAPARLRAMLRLPLTPPER